MAHVDWAPNGCPETTAKERNKINMKRAGANNTAVAVPCRGLDAQSLLGAVKLPAPRGMLSLLS